jgi:hypothetical protein
MTTRAFSISCNPVGGGPRSRNVHLSRTRGSFRRPLRSRPRPRPGEPGHLEIPVNGGSADGKRQKNAQDRAEKAVLREVGQHDGEENATEHHGNCIKLGSHQQGRSTGQHIAREAASDRGDHPQDDRPGRAEIRAPG